jgi:large subunit ribosomal protein L13
MKSFRMRAEDVERRWLQIDADGKVLGKIAVKAANLLMGKEKPTFTPGVDMGDFVLVTNAAKVKVTGRKKEKKIYRHHTMYLGGLVEQPFDQVVDTHPERIVQLAVRRMLPKTTLGKHLFKRLKVYAGAQHPHAAQNPQLIEIGRPVFPPQSPRGDVNSPPQSPRGDVVKA